MNSQHLGVPGAVESRNRREAALRTAIAPVVPFLDDESVVEIMLNADGRVWTERAGIGMALTAASLAPDEALRILRVVATEMNVELSDRSPSVAGKLPIWGARVQGAIPPIVEAPVFSLRKPAKLAFGLDQYVERLILAPSEADALRRAVRDRANILVGGGTGSGKTTFANALLREIAETGDRTYIVEDNPELQCSAPNRLQVLVHPSCPATQTTRCDWAYDTKLQGWLTLGAGVAAGAAGGMLLWSARHIPATVAAGPGSISLAGQF